MARSVITDFNGEENYIYKGQVLVANKKIHTNILKIIKKYFSE